MTGHTDDVVLRAGVAEDEIAVIEKPSQTDALLARMLEVIGSA